MWGLVLGAGVVAAQAPAGGERPEFSGRVVKVFDFEERAVNPNPVPRYWVRVHDAASDESGRVPFPSWNNAELRYTGDDASALSASGEGAVRMSTSGGSARLVLEPGVVPVFESADYAVAVKVRTRGLRAARARLTALFLDREGKAIAASEKSTEPMLSEGAWRTIAVDMLGEYPGAAYLQARLEVLQPDQLLVPGQSRERPNRQDFRGEAWFDDVSIVQLPRVEVKTNSPLNVISRPDRPELVLLVRDLTGEALTMRLRVFDSDGALVETSELPLGSGASGAKVTPRLTRTGWYRAILEIANGTSRVGSDFVDFVWLPGDGGGGGDEAGEMWAGRVRGSSPDRTRFGLVVNEVPGRVLADLPRMVRQVGSGSITLPLWSEQYTAEMGADPGGNFLSTVDALLTNWQEVTLSLARVPEGLSKTTKADADDPWAVVGGGDGAWKVFLEPALDKLGQRVRRWQVGRAGDDRAFWKKDVTGDVARVGSALSRTVAGPVVVVPSRVDRGHAPGSLMYPSGASSLLAYVPDSWTAAGVREAVVRWEEEVGGSAWSPELTLAFGTHEPEDYGHAAGASELVKRGVEAWGAMGEGRAPNLALVQPWRLAGERRSSVMPLAELAAWRCLIDRLGDRRVLGRYATAPGVVCYVLGPAEGVGKERGGALVAWNEGEPGERAYVEGYLGPGPIAVVDIFGNASEAPAGPASRTGRCAAGVRVAVTDRPVFLEGVDVELAMFLSSFRLDPEFIDTASESHEHALVLENPWRTGITGRVSVIEPARGENTGSREGRGRLREWRISPRQNRFTLASGNSQRVPFSISFGPGVEIGPKEFVFELELSAETVYPPVEVRRFMEVGLSSVRVDLAQQRTEEGDAIIEASVTNLGKTPSTLTLTCFAPGFPRKTASVTGLVAGTQVVRRFAYPKAADKLLGQKVTLTLVDTDKNAKLNSSIRIE